MFVKVVYCLHEYVHVLCKSKSHFLFLVFKLRDLFPEILRI